MKQLGMRGRARKFDSDGVCGKQVLVLTCDFERLVIHADQLFPGATLSKYRPKPQRKKLTQQEMLLEILTDPETPESITGAEIARRWGIAKWSDVSTNVMKVIKGKALGNLGWTYEARPGPGGGARFVKTGTAVFRLGG